MAKVVFNMTMSLDGFVAGPNDGPENGLGDGGEALFNWYFSGDTEVSVGSGSPMLKVSAQSAEVLKQSWGPTGQASGAARHSTSLKPGVAIHPEAMHSLLPTTFPRNGLMKDRRLPL